MSKSKGKEGENEVNPIAEAIKATSGGDFTTSLQITHEWLKKVCELDAATVYDPATVQVWSTLSNDLLSSSQSIATDEVLKNHDSWRQSIIDISSNFSNLFDGRLHVYGSRYSEARERWNEGLDAIDVAPLVESAKDAAEALKAKPEQPYTEKEAKAALPKLVNVASKYDEVTEAFATLVVRTKSGGEFMMNTRLTREQILSGMELDRAFVNGQPTLIALPKRLNRELGARKHSIVIDGDQPTALPPPDEDLVPLGSYARQFVEKADRLTHTITFRGGRSLRMLPDRIIAWQVVEHLLSEGEAKTGGWVELPRELQDKKWSGQFRVPIPSPLGAGTMADPHHDMTLVRHHIQTTAKQGRRGASASVPKFRFCRTLDHAAYDPLVERYKKALAEAKRRAKAVK